eukprot:TRINITY_DN26751_c0_g1_i1.p1 TRINITY_DN26751_c0_g1~~TRINITY_DN26751_c0_g1_i1.p1  ORF type:complete len:158 (+),score=27.51 TRINITY_DN26751_c0_g1_i1:189-662(+)
MQPMDPDLVVRDLEPADYHKGYIKVLGFMARGMDALTQVQFEQRLAEINRDPLHHMVVIEQLSSGTIVGAGTIFCERKFIHNCGLVGHIEDIAVDPSFKRKRLGSRMIADLMRRGRDSGCYKIILDCSKDNIPFYEHCGFTHKDSQMVLFPNQPSKL